MLTYQLDTSELHLFVNRMGLEADAAISIFFMEARAVLQAVVIETIMEVAPGAGPGFPTVYTEHLIAVASANPPVRIVFGGLDIDLTMLGTYEDYTKGFHRHAQAADGGQIELPWSGQEPKNPVEVRTLFWESVASGQPFLPKQGKMHTEGMYDETILNRIAIWGTKAPEWWVLQNGSSSFPEVNPTALSEVMTAKAAIALTPLYEEALQMAVIRADSGYGTKPRGTVYYNVREKSGRWIARV
jgi:hypothetical protein